MAFLVLCIMWYVKYCTYSKLIIGILFTFPKRSGILEAVHFICSVVAEQSGG